MRASVLISIVLGLSCAQDFSAFSVVSSTTDDASTTPAPETSTPEINLSEEEGSTTPVQETLYGGEASSEEEGSITPVTDKPAEEEASSTSTMAFSTTSTTVEVTTTQSTSRLTGAPEDSDSKASSSLFVFPIILGTVLFAITF
ncbi:uncharacterized protein CELE_E02H9.7 [Caenorhabditis elegans]|uniref:Secreted protein n=1 Tax=Caenorhabditis elegans TaxID=6239 RepID=Q9TZA1_CAEEL|nr:Secreted protein [Caenorhabditis elegans]CCD68639.1 Secreted protein [Caenorhabditis elegans]|eukprot:NP_497557.2 Uncharacterized protein CELE_E02H9.7 [Caenorhabditis elegans]